MKVKYAEFSGNLFLAGRNFGPKLGLPNHDKLEMNYVDGKLTVEYQGEVAIFPCFSGYMVIASKEEKWQAAKQIVSSTQPPSGKIKAQVGAPAGIKID